MKIKFAAAAAIAALCVSGGAVAGEAPQTVKLSVSADGLDLTKTADVRKLRNRIADAAAVACDPADRMIVTTLPDYQCRREGRFSAIGPEDAPPVKQDTPPQGGS